MRIIFALIVFVVFGTINLTAKQNIVSLYRLLPKKIIPDFKKFRLFKIEGKWFAEDESIDYGNVEVKVDIRNGFIQLYTSGSGRTWWQIVLFLDSNENIFIGVNSIQDLGNGVLNNYVFYRYIDKLFVKAKTNLFPDNLFYKFFKKSISKKNIIRLKYLFKYFSLIKISLPHYGSEVGVSLCVENFDIFIAHPVILNLKPCDVTFLKNMRKSILKQKLTLKWDKLQAKFVFK